MRNQRRVTIEVSSDEDEERLDRERSLVTRFLLTPSHINSHTLFFFFFFFFFGDLVFVLPPYTREHIIFNTLGNGGETNEKGKPFFSSIFAGLKSRNNAAATYYNSLNPFKNEKK